MTNTMSERDELTRALAAAYGESPSSADEDAADAILAAGYRKPRQITTIEELDTLPCGSVILDRTGLSLHKNEFTGWRASNGAKDISREMLENEALPATVLHVGKP